MTAITDLFENDNTRAAVAAIAATITVCVAGIMLGGQVPVASVPAPTVVQPVLRVTMTKQTALAPADLQVVTHQDVQAVTDREVCVFAQAEQTMVGCWQQGKPDVLVNRTFRFTVPGEYDVFAQAALPSGVVRSNTLRVLIAE